ncbi:LuxR family transcriptional regulator [Spirillospora sp. CA-253888]
MNKLSLTAAAREHLARARSASSGRSSTTVHGGHEHVLRQTLIALRAGAGLDEHVGPGEATLHVLAGRVRLATAADSWDAVTGDLLVVPEESHTLEALEDSAIFLTVAKRLH